MATVYITEFQNGASGIGTLIAQLLPQPALAQQNVAVSGTSQSVQLSAKTNAIEIYSDTDFTFAVAAAAAPTAAVSGGNRIKAGERLRYAVPPSGYIAVIT